jgi:hypothetical protein
MTAMILQQPGISNMASERLLTQALETRSEMNSGRLMRRQRPRRNEEEINAAASKSSPTSRFLDPSRTLEEIGQDTCLFASSLGGFLKVLHLQFYASENF